MWIAELFRVDLNFLISCASFDRQCSDIVKKHTTSEVWASFMNRIFVSVAFLPAAKQNSNFSLRKLMFTFYTLALKENQDIVVTKIIDRSCCGASLHSQRDNECQKESSHIQVSDNFTNSC